MLWVYAPKFSLRYACTDHACKARVKRAQVFLYESHQARFLAHELAFEETRVIRMRHHELEIAVDVAQKLLAGGARSVQGGARLLAKLAEERSQREAVQFFLAGKVVIEQSFVYACGSRDGSDASPGQAVLGKILFGCSEDALHRIRMPWTRQSGSQSVFGNARCCGHHRRMNCDRHNV